MLGRDLPTTAIRQGVLALELLSKPNLVSQNILNFSPKILCLKTFWIFRQKFCVEAEFLDEIGIKVLVFFKGFPPCYSQKPLLTDFNPPPPPQQKWFETGL